MTGNAKPGRARLAVLGGGPIGIEAALYGAALGHDVVVYEGGELGHAVRLWQHVTLFSPWQLNTTPLGRRLLVEAGGKLPELASHPTGAELLSEYLEPLARLPLLRDRIRTRSRVVAVGRSGLRKTDLLPAAERAAHRFRILIEDTEGEHVEFADVLFDCTGTYLCPNAIGDGGIPAPGERWLEQRLIRHLPDVLGSQRKRFAGRRVLLIGAGLSAATAAVELAALCAAEPSTRVTWATRRAQTPPYQPMAGDPLRGRAALHEQANRVALAGRDAASSPALRFRPGMLIDTLAAEGHQLRVRLCGPGGEVCEELFDEIVGLTGFGPDRDLYRELQIHECYASLGPMKLAATLVKAGGDCLAQPTPGPETLQNPEPNFYALGAKSYGRNSAFLLQLGHAQVRAAFALLHAEPALDLYA